MKPSTASTSGQEQFPSDTLSSQVEQQDVDMASWSPGTPVERADGSLVCKLHGLVICHRCAVDYSFMLDTLREEDFQTPPRQNDQGNKKPSTASTSGQEHLPSDASSATQSLPSRFQPPLASDCPLTLFTYGENSSFHRFVRKSNPKEILIYTGGACLSNGMTNLMAGCAFVVRPGEPAKYGRVTFRLENKGPRGTVEAQTSNRAELRAVIGALQFRIWYGEEWSRIVIATDSYYAVKGATEWVGSWEQNGWKTSKEQPVENRDLWELLLRKIKGLAEKGVDVLFWHIPREFNDEADAGATQGATLEEVPKFVKLSELVTGGPELAWTCMPWVDDAEGGHACKT
ncbi:hypothetical protein LZ554_005563 [Drepanopeziza brunnea f. sp. 'monogermtubi']|nr:hypothetical protein LZ554_005563 [Drepanopeziza brunnea f. sp. 'monogermtubi']